MVRGVYAPERFLEIFRDYIYFQDEIFDCDEREIVCRYPQFFAARLLKQSIVKSVVSRQEKAAPTSAQPGAARPIRWRSLPDSFRSAAVTFRRSVRPPSS